MPRYVRNRRLHEPPEPPSAEPLIERRRSSGGSVGMVSLGGRRGPTEAADGGGAHGHRRSPSLVLDASGSEVHAVRSAQLISDGVIALYDVHPAVPAEHGDVGTRWMCTTISACDFGRASAARESGLEQLTPFLRSLSCLVHPPHRAHARARPHMRAHTSAAYTQTACARTRAVSSRPLVGGAAACASTPFVPFTVLAR
jgi:hypothetical protein